MKLSTQALTRNIGRKTLVLKKNSPHIFFVGGVVGVVAAGVLACRATLQLEAALDDIRSDLDAVKKINTGDSNVDNPQKPYQYVAYVSVKSAVVFGKLYGPSVLLGAASVAALTGSHIQLTRRNAALTATVGLAARAYEEYRLRVQEEIGKEREMDVHNNAKEQVVDVDGKAEIHKLVGEGGGSIYARHFDERNTNWVNNWETNAMFLEHQQNYMNHILQARGHLFLNDVYDALDLERSTPGSVVGWVINGDGDGYVDFGLYDASNMDGNKIKRTVLLDFNVDGVVFDLIEGQK